MITNTSNSFMSFLLIFLFLKQAVAGYSQTAIDTLNFGDSLITTDNYYRQILWEKGKAGLYDAKDNRLIIKPEWDMLVVCGADDVIGKKGDQMALISAKDGVVLKSNSADVILFGVDSEESPLEQLQIGEQRYSIVNNHHSHTSYRVFDDKLNYANKYRNGISQYAENILLVKHNSLREVQKYDMDGDPVFDKNTKPIKEIIGSQSARFFDTSKQRFLNLAYKNASICPSGVLVETSQGKLGLLDKGLNTIINPKYKNQWTANDSIKIFGLFDIKLHQSLESENISYIKQGKMGLAFLDLEQLWFFEILPARYDLIVKDHLVITNDTIYLLDENFKEINNLKSSFHFSYMVDELEGLGAYKVDSSYFDFKKPYAAIKYFYSLIDPEIDIKKINKKRYQVQINTSRTTPLLDEFGALVYDDYGYRLFDLTGGKYAGVYDISKQEWEIEPVYEFIAETENGYVAWESKEKLIYLKDKENFESLMEDAEVDTGLVMKYLLPSGSQVFNAVDNNPEMYYTVHGKMGMFDLRAYPELPTIIKKAEQDYISYFEDLGVYVHINNGLFSFSYNSAETIKLPKIPQKNISFEESDYSLYVSIDGERFRLIEKDGKNHWSIDKTKNYAKKIYEIELLSDGNILHNVDCYELTELLGDYDEGTELVSGITQGGVYNPKDNRWAIAPQSSVELKDNGFIVYHIPDFYQDTVYLGYVSADYEYKTEVDYDGVAILEDVVLVRKNNKISLLNFHAEEIFKPFVYKGYSIGYRDGFIFSPYQEQFDEFGDPIYDEFGDPMVLENIIKDKAGNNITIPYRGMMLFSNGIVLIEKETEKGFKYGFYDLKNKKLLHEPTFDILDYSENDKIWIKKEGKWDLAEVGAGVTFSQNKYDDANFFWCNEDAYATVLKDGKTGLLTLDNIEVLPLEYDSIIIPDAESDFLNLLITIKSGKYGLYDVLTKKTILEPEYISLSIGTEKELYVQSKAGYGAFLLNSIKKDGSFDWSIKPNNPYPLNWFVAKEFLETGAENKKGVIDLSKSILVPYEYGQISLLYTYLHNDIKQEELMSKKYIVVSKDINSRLKAGLYESSKNLIIPCKYHSIAIFDAEAELMFVSKIVDEKELFGIWSIKKSKEVVPCEYIFEYRFVNDQYVYIFNKENKSFSFEELLNKYN